MNYGELKSQFAGLLKRRDLSPSQRDAWLQDALSRAQRLLRVPAMSKSVIVPYNSEFGGVNIPADFIQLHSLVADDTELFQRDLTTVLSLARTTGVPQAFVRRNGVFVFGPTPDEGTPIRVDYFAELSALVADEDTNWLANIAPSVILNGAMVPACRWFIDPRMGAFEDAFSQGISELNDQAAADELANSQAGWAYTFPED